MNNRTRLPLPEPDKVLKLPNDIDGNLEYVNHYTGNQMHAYSDATLAAERITAAHWQSLAEANLKVADMLTKENAALRERVKVLEDELRNIAQTNVNKWEIDDPIDRLRQFKEWAQNRARAALEATK